MNLDLDAFIQVFTLLHQTVFGSIQEVDGLRGRAKNTQRAAVRLTCSSLLQQTALTLFMMRLEKKDGVFSRCAWKLRAMRASGPTEK